MRERANGILNDGMTMNAVSMNIGCFTRANLHLRQRFQATGRTEDRPYGGRPRVTTLGEDCYIRNTHLRNRFQTATTTAANNHCILKNRISFQTVRNRLLESGPRALVHMLVVFLARRHCVNRVNWSRTHQRWLRQQWNSVLISDESRYSVHRGDGRVRVFRRRNECYTDCHVLERDRFEGGGLSLSGRALYMTFTVISSLSKGI